MKKVSKEIAQAFIFNKKRKLGNTYTKQAESYTYNGVLQNLGGLFLHDNKIAWWDDAQHWDNEECTILSNNIHLCFSMCGSGTQTTRERLNALFNLLFRNDLVQLFQKNYEQFLHVNGADFKIDDDAIFTLRKVNNCPVFLDD